MCNVNVTVGSGPTDMQFVAMASGNCPAIGTPIGDASLTQPITFCCTH
jgi:hypothetical protein